ncbi:MAG: ACP S-malonyltransferase [Propionibacteriaceae bacterium]|nr:ACP S-malonyltransferase [Propionibacteriaceae bacterium]
MIAFLFPGQGTQVPGMFNLLKGYESQVAEVFDAASDAAGLDVRDLCLRGSAQTLRRTENTQVAVTAMNLAFCQVLTNRGVRPDLVMGHSVGQFSAIAASGAASVSDIMGLVMERARLMGQIVEHGGLYAVSGLGIDDVRSVCDEPSLAGRVWVALYNAPSQIVVGGQISDLTASVPFFQRAGASVTPLNVSHAFHTPVMVGMESAFTAYVRGMTLSDPLCPIIMNCSGQVAATAEQIVEDVIDQCCHPVLWAEGLKRLFDSSTGDLVIAEVGPGRTLTGLMRGNDPDQKMYAVSVPRHLSQLLDLVSCPL